MKAVHLIGVPLDLGAGRRGVDMGPSAFRIAGIRDHGALVKMARAVGRTLGKISHQSGRSAPSRPERHPGLSGIGATEDQVNMSAQVPQRINAQGTKVEDLAGIGAHDAQGG